MSAIPTGAASHAAAISDCVDEGGRAAQGRLTMRTTWNRLGIPSRRAQDRGHERQAEDQQRDDAKDGQPIAPVPHRCVRRSGRDADLHDLVDRLGVAIRIEVVHVPAMHVRMLMVGNVGMQGAVGHQHEAEAHCPTEDEVRQPTHGGASVPGIHAEKSAVSASELAPCGAHSLYTTAQLPKTLRASDEWDGARI